MKLIIIFVLAFILVFNAEISASNKLEIVGTIVGQEELYGHIYDGSAITPRLLIVRVDQKIKGEIKAKYILVNYQWRLDDKITPFGNSQATQWNFALTKEKKCSFTLIGLSLFEKI